MTCEEVRLELPGFIRGELDEQTASRVTTHLRSCASCRKERESLEATIDAIRLAVPAAPPAQLRDGVVAIALAARIGSDIRAAVPSLPPADLRDRVLAAATAPSAPAELRSRRPREAVLAVAAVIAVLFAFFSWSQLQDARDRLGDESPSLPVNIPTGHETYAFTLDGAMTSEASLVHYRHDNFRLLLSAAGFDATPSGYQYAVWLRGAPGDVPLGGFRLSRPDDFKVPFAIAVDPALYPEVLVTLEPNDGNPARTGEVVSSAVMDASKVHHGPYND